MKIGAVLWVAAAGGLLYLHRRRGGEWTVQSLVDSARLLWDGVERSGQQAELESRRRARETARVRAVTENGELPH